MEISGLRAGEGRRAARDEMDATRLSFRTFAVLFAALFALATAPLWEAEILPLFDYPNHLARMGLLAELPQSATLRQFYEAAWHPIPNLAMDVIVPPLLRVMPLAQAGKVFVLLTFFLIAAGPAVLHRVLFGRWSAWPCLAFLLLYNRLLIWGFVNYLFGVGLALFAFAGWVVARRRRLALRLAIGTLAALALYFAHLMAAGAYGILVFGYEGGLLLHRRAPWREVFAAFGVAAATFLPALAIMVFASPDSSAGAISFAKPWRKVDLLFSVFDAYSRPFDVACFAIAVLGVGWAYARRWVRLEPAMILPLALLGLTYLVMPSQLMTASGADRRLPLVLALVLLGGSTWTLPRLRVQSLFFGAAGIMLAARLAIVAVSWHGSARIYAPALSALGSVPAGSRIAVAFPIDAVNAGPAPLVHLPTLAVPRRQAFVPTLFAFPTQQPVALRPAYRRLADGVPPVRLWGAFTGGAPLDAEARAALDQYDYVVFVDRTPFRLADRSGLEPVALSPTFQLYRLVHEGPGWHG